MPVTRGYMRALYPLPQGGEPSLRDPPPPHPPGGGGTVTTPRGRGVSRGCQGMKGVGLGCVKRTLRRLGTGPVCVKARSCLASSPPRLVTHALVRRLAETTILTDLTLEQLRAIFHLKRERSTIPVAHLVTGVGCASGLGQLRDSELREV